MTIRKATEKEAQLIAEIVSESNRDVAKKFNLTMKNNPRHPSFYSESWVRSDLQRGEEYFLYRLHGKTIGCVAFEQPQAELAYLNRLSVLPRYRRQGTGASLVRYIIDYARMKNISIISIGIIASHQQLKAWYEKLGFIEVETRTFEHLPFAVTYMHFRLDR